MRETTHSEHIIKFTLNSNELNLRASEIIHINGGYFVVIKMVSFPMVHSTLSPSLRPGLGLNVRICRNIMTLSVKFCQRTNNPFYYHCNLILYTFAELTIRMGWLMHKPQPDAIEWNFQVHNKVTENHTPHPLNKV